MGSIRGKTRVDATEKVNRAFQTRCSLAGDLRVSSEGQILRTDNDRYHYHQGTDMEASLQSHGGQESRYVAILPRFQPTKSEFTYVRGRDFEAIGEHTDKELLRWGQASIPAGTDDQTDFSFASQRRGFWPGTTQQGYGQW